MAIYDAPIHSLKASPLTSTLRGQGGPCRQRGVTLRVDAQYSGLETLQKEYEDRGFTVLGIPCNQFGEQEPGSPANTRLSFDHLRRHVSDDRGR